jgi:hypothetical protein
MGVVTKYGDAARDPGVVPAVVIPSAQTSARIRNFVSTVEIANGDSIASVVYFGQLPSNARLVAALAKLFYDALTGVTDFDLGGVLTPDALVNGADIHLAGSSSAVAAIGIEKYTQPLWKLLGYTADPGGSLDIIGTLKAAATADGSITLALPWAFD